MPSPFSDQPRKSGVTAELARPMLCKLGMQLDNLLKPRNLLLALCLGAAAGACSIDTDDDDGDSDSCHDDCGSAQVDCEGDCDDGDDSCIGQCGVDFDDCDKDCD